MPHSYGPKIDLGPDGYHSQCASCGYEYGSHMAEGEYCPVSFARGESFGDPDIITFHETQKFALRSAEGADK
jgi:hypothetical protein